MAGPLEGGLGKARQGSKARPLRAAAALSTHRAARCSSPPAEALSRRVAVGGRILGDDLAAVTAVRPGHRGGAPHLRCPWRLKTGSPLQQASRRCGAGQVR